MKPDTLRPRRPGTPAPEGETLSDRGGSISWMARNPVAANLLMIALIVGGILMSFRMRKEVFPRVAPDEISILVAYPGASPAEVEQGIILAIEEAVRPLDGIKKVEASAMEGLASVEVELEVGTDRNKALADVKNAVDRITSFPEEIERPVVNLPEWQAEAISVVLFGDGNEKVLHALAEQIREALLQLPDVNQVEVAGMPPLEISIEVPQRILRTYGLTLPRIAAMVRSTAIELPAGGVKTDGGEWLLRTAERRNLGKEFANIAVLTGTDGSPVRLGAIADIQDGFAETDVQAFFDGKPAVLLQILSVGDQSPTDVAEAVKKFVEGYKSQLPPGMTITTWNDRSKLYEERLDLLLRNAAIGLALVLLILGLFLEPKLAFWVMMGIPISFLGSLILLPSLDISINMISLFAFIVTLGMVVDDAIVVGENAFRLKREGMSPLKAAIHGARQVSQPVFFSIATSVAAFTPLLFVPGIRGKWMLSIPVVVILVLTISLLESFFVLPAHLGHLRKGKDEGLFGFFPRIPSTTRVQGSFSRAVERFIERFYCPLVGAAVRQRWLTLSLFLVILLTAYGLLAGGRVKNIDFPREESDWVIGEASLPFGSAAEETRKVMDRMVAAAQEVIEENGGPEISMGIFSMLGVSFRRRGGRWSGGHVTSIAVTLVPTDERDIGAFAFADKWREKVEDIPGLETLNFDSSTGHGGSKPIDLQLSHSNITELEEAARKLATQLRSYEGVKDVEDGIELGKPQLDFKLSADGTAEGLTSLDIASQVRSAFYGAEAFRQQRGRHEVKVMVRLPREERETLHSVEEMMIQTPGGGEMPLRQAARVEYGRAYTMIDRTDGRRTIRVKADVEEDKANPGEVIGALFREGIPKLKAEHPGLGFGFAGRQRDMADFFDYLILSYIMVIIVMFLLVAVPLRSVLQPFLVVILPAVLFGIAGAIFGHLVMGLPMSMVSWMGVVALAGVVVNDSIVLVAAANRFRNQGLEPVDAVMAAAKQRFRPILLTSLTTFGGLAPMIFETSLQARVLIPMAVSLGFGVLFSTIIVLLLVPSLFVMVENLRTNLRKGWDYIFPSESGAIEETP